MRRLRAARAVGFSPLAALVRSNSSACPRHAEVGAGEGNRTLVVSLEGFCSTIELHPQRLESSLSSFGGPGNGVLKRAAVRGPIATTRCGWSTWVSATAVGFRIPRTVDVRRERRESGPTTV